jgi:hypothetical protein
MALSLAQLAIVKAPQRFKVVIAGRRFGKTHLSIRELCLHAREPNKDVIYCAPTYKQAKNIVWKKLKYKLLDLKWVQKLNETELSIVLKNNSTITLKGLENFDSIRGGGYDYLVIDEFADCDPEAWYSVLRPTLADRQGQALFIGTPKGMNWAHDLFIMAEEYPDEWASFQYTTIDGGNVKPEEIEAAQRTLDERTFRQEFMATFETFSGRVYYAFERTNNVKPFNPPAERPSYEIHVGIDFNVDPICAVVAVKAGSVLWIIDEVKIYGSNTDELVEELRTRYPTQRIVCYPDPAGSQRKTSAGGRTDHTILRNAGFTVQAPHAHNPIRDGVNAVNAKLRNSRGETSLYIDAKCKYVIECLEKLTFKEGTSLPDKTSGFDHLSDALRYMVDYLYPIRTPVQPPEVRMWGHKIA